MAPIRHFYPATHPLSWAGLTSKTTGLTCRLAVIQRRFELHQRRHKPLWQMKVIRQMQARGR